MGYKSNIKAQRRNEKIARVQRERDIAEVFGVQTMYDIMLRGHRPHDRFHVAANYTDVVIDGTPSYTPPLEVWAYWSSAGTTYDGDWTEHHLSWEFNLHEIPKSNSYFVNFKDVDVAAGDDFITLLRAGVHFTGFYWDEDKEEIASFFSVYNAHEYAPPGEILQGGVRCALKDGQTRWCVFVNMSADNPIVLTDGITLIHESLRAISLLTKTNIELIDRPPNPRLSAISEREFGRPLTTYKVLKVNTSHKQYQGVMQESGLQDFDPRRMHVVRGHHAEYGTNGRGLHFGKYERKIWIPAHVRGNEELGIVVKDYEVVSHAN